MPRLAANLSTMFREWPFLDRFDAAAEAGFSAVECQFPYQEPADRIAQRLDRTLGRAVVARLRQDGGAVAAIDLAASDALPAEAAERIGGIDLTDQASVADAIAPLGPVAGLVNVAGGFAWETIADGAVETWERMFALNVKTALNACRAALGLLLPGGAIVNVGAAAANRADLGMAAYAASKSGGARLTEGLATELKPRGIRVNAVLPSIIDTPANRAEMPDADFTSWATPVEVANAIAFLLSDAASGITGALLPVSGRV